jgi:hypothetical protein
MELIKEGIQWGIGNRQKTKILSDKWIPGVQPYHLKPLVHILDGAMVSLLIDEGLGCWDEATIRVVFEEGIAEQIMQVPISRQGGDDFASWPLAKGGEYTVKSGYNLARTRDFLLHQSSTGAGFRSDQADVAKGWKKLWGITAPGKMLITLWRFAHDCLPTAHQLRRRHIECQDDCVFCHREEKVEHVFLFCQFAVEVWRD